MRLFIYLLLGLFALTLSSLMVLLLWPYASPQPDLVSLLLPDSCPAPCWYGINTDETAHRQTAERIMTLPAAQNTGLMEWQFGVGQQVRLENGRDVLIHPQGLRWGDVLSHLGQPTYQTNGNAYDQVAGLGSLYLQFFYAPQRFIVTLLLTDKERLSPLTPVRQLSYPTGPFPRPEGAHDYLPYVRMAPYPYRGGYNCSVAKLKEIKPAQKKKRCSRRCRL
jgi:hypothetical protein